LKTSRAFQCFTTGTISNVDLVKTLLTHGANPLTSDESNNTSLHLASKQGSIPMLSILLSAILTQVRNNEKKSVVDLWPRDKSELDVLLTPLQNVYTKTMHHMPVFGMHDVGEELMWKIFHYLDKKTLHGVVPCVNQYWRVLYESTIQKNICRKE